MIDTVLIAGPTASGKSAAALALAEATGGVIVNADSMQVYRELRILSARPDAADEARAEHRLFGHVSALTHYSVGRWVEDARAALADIHAAARLAIVVGGTGLYFKALEEGLAPAPSAPQEVRARAAALRADMGEAAFHAALAARDPAAARLAPGDAQRVLRAFEVIEHTGRSLADWQAEAARPVVDPARVARLVIELDRPTLYERIDRRFDAMMADGGLEEARAFWALDPDARLPSTKALGLPQLRRALDGEIALDEAMADAKMQTRRFAKRQGTWFRNQTPHWPRLDPEAERGRAWIASLVAAMAR